MAPAFAGETTAREVAENTAAGEPIGDPVTATDMNDARALVYSLDEMGDMYFDIDGVGQLMTEAALDFESGTTSYSGTVTATDGSGASDTMTVTITVTDENDAPVLRCQTRR